MKDEILALSFSMSREWKLGQSGKHFRPTTFTETITIHNRGLFYIHVVSG
jgi:hypothetical protein